MEVQPPHNIGKAKYSAIAVLAVFIGFALIAGGLFIWNTMRGPGGLVPPPAAEEQLVGFVEFTEIEGGCWYILVDRERGDAEQIELIGIDRDILQQYRGEIVEARGRFRPDMASICQIGRIFEVEEIVLISDLNGSGGI